MCIYRVIPYQKSSTFAPGPFATQVELCDLSDPRSLSLVYSSPSSVLKCLCEVFVWGFGVLFLCVCVSVSGVLFSVGVCV